MLHLGHYIDITFISFALQ